VASRSDRVKVAVVLAACVVLVLAVGVGFVLGVLTLRDMLDNG
jgi:hypothetical protein